MAVYPADAIPNLPACIFDGTREPVKRSRPAKSEQMGTGLGDAESLGPELFAGDAMIPPFPHEREPVGRITHHGIDARGVERCHHFAAVPVVNDVRHQMCPANP